MEHKVCKNCKWNEYPICKGTKIDGVFMNIENLAKEFKCGIKNMDKIQELVLFPSEKSELELLKEKVLQLEQKIEILNK